MKTLSDLKREMIPGKRMSLVYRFKPLDKPVLREVVKTQTNAIVCKDPNDQASKGSWLMWPKASLIEVTDKGFKVYGPGKRELTAQEKSIIANKPKDAEQTRIDLLSDGSSMYWRCKKYYKDQNAEYLQGLELSQGKKLDHQTGLCIDETIKGELQLEYRF